MPSADAPSSATSQGRLPTPTERFSHPRLFALTSALIGIQVCWAVQVGYVTKSFLTLGMPQRYVSYAWLAGPIAGIVMQPVVGVLSDRCTSRFGRRRPFLAGGASLTTLCLLLFAYAGPLGQFFGDTVSTSDTIVPAPRGIAIGLAAFWALDFSINAAQGPLRALLSDVVPPAQHSTGNSYFALATGLGNCFGSLLGAVKLSHYLPFFPGDLQALFSVAALVLVITVSITVFCIQETPLPALLARAQEIRYESKLSSSSSSARDDSPSTRRRLMYESTRERDDSSDSIAESEANSSDEPISFFEAGRIAPHPFWPAFIIQCFSWFGWFTLFVFGTSWVGAEVVSGSFTSAPGTPLRERYDHGVRMGNLGIGLQSVLTVVCAPALPWMIRRSSNQAVYFVASLVLGVALCSALVLKHDWEIWIATVMIAITGFPWAVTMTVPWSLMSEAVARTAPERSGIYATMFNLSQCFPEVMVSLVAERVVHFTGKQSAVLGLGGAAVFVGAGFIVALGVGKDGAETDGGAGVGGRNGSRVEETRV